MRRPVTKSPLQRGPHLFTGSASQNPDILLLSLAKTHPRHRIDREDALRIELNATRHHQYPYLLPISLSARSGFRPGHSHATSRTRPKSGDPHQPTPPPAILSNQAAIAKTRVANSQAARRP